MRSLAALPLALLFVVACGDDSNDNNNDSDNDNTSDQDQDDQDQDDQDQGDNDQPVPDAAPDAPDGSTLPDSTVPDGALPDGALPDAMIDGSVPTPDAMIDGSVPMPDAMIDGSMPTPDAMIDGSVPTPDAMIDGSVPTPDAMIDGSVPTPDAMADGSVPTPDAAIDANTNSCTIEATLGTITPPNQFAEETTQTGSVPSYTYAGLLNLDVDFDAIQFELWDGFGVFETGIVPGTYSIAGDELAYATCGACIFAFGDVTDTGATQAYFATGGSLTLTQVGPSMIGTLDNMTFGSLDNTTGDPDGLCTTTLASFSFNVTITDNTARASGRRIEFTPVGGKSPIAKSQVCWPKSTF